MARGREERRWCGRGAESVCVRERGRGRRERERKKKKETATNENERTNTRPQTVGDTNDKKSVLVVIFVSNKNKGIQNHICGCV